MHSHIENSVTKDVDIFISHHAPTGVLPNKDFQEEGVVLLNNIVDKLNPKFHVHCHHNKNYETRYKNTKVIGLGNFGKNRNSFKVLRNFKKAEIHLRSAIKLKPDFAAAYNVLGNTLVAQGSLEDALAEYTTAIEIKPDFFEAHINIGIYWDNKGEFAKALSLFEKAIQLQPQNAQGYFRLAN